MGYSMTIVGTTPEWDRMKRERERAWDAANAATDSEAKSAAWDAYFSLTSPWEFDCNVFSMAFLATTMAKLGMLVDDDLPFPPYPPHADADDHTSPAFQAYRDACDRHVTRAPDPCDGILAEKFCSNDGWLVTAPEIKAALATYAAISPVTTMQLAIVLDASQRTDQWMRWIDFLRVAAEHDGFRVW